MECEILGGSGGGQGGGDEVLNWSWEVGMLVRGKRRGGKCGRTFVYFEVGLDSGVGGVDDVCCETHCVDV